MGALGIFSTRFSFFNPGNDCPIVPAANRKAFGFRVAARLAKEVSQLWADEVLVSLDSDMTHDLSSTT
jgi:hypothetical protein